MIYKKDLVNLVFEQANGVFTRKDIKTILDLYDLLLVKKIIEGEKVLIYNFGDYNINGCSFQEVIRKAIEEENVRYVNDKIANIVSKIKTTDRNYLIENYIIERDEEEFERLREELL